MFHVHPLLAGVIRNKHLVHGRFRILLAIGTTGALAGPHDESGAHFHIAYRQRIEIAPFRADVVLLAIGSNRPLRRGRLLPIASRTTSALNGAISIRCRYAM